MASPTPYSTFTCFDEILTEVQGNGEAIQEIIDVVASGGGGSLGGGSEEESGVIQTPNYPDFYPYSSYEVIKALTLHCTVTITLLGVEPRGRRRKADQAHL